MPNRVVREAILRSDKVNRLTWTSEVFYRRLMSVADDFGRYDGRVSIIRSALYALRSDKVSESDIVKWMDECQEAELIRFYEVDKKPYLEIIDFGQTLRMKKSKYPECLASDEQVMSKRMLERKPKPNLETESEIESESEIFAITIDFLRSEFENASEWNNSIIRDLKISFEKLEILRAEFLKEIELKEKFYDYKGLRDAKSHFISWLKIKLKNQHNGQNTTGNQRLTRENERKEALSILNNVLGVGKETNSGPDSDGENKTIAIDHIQKAG